jgi:hypothetical protein
MLELKGGEGRVFTYSKGIDLFLPTDFKVPTCQECGAEFLDDELEEKAKELLRPKLLKSD